MKKSVVLAVVLSLLLVAGSAYATPWSQSWVANGLFDQIEGFIVNGDVDFREPGVGNFFPSSTAATWQGDLINPHYIKAWGDDVNQVNFTTWFTDNSLFAVDWFLFHDNELSYSARFTWNEYYWSSGAIPCGTTYDRNPPAPVPESGTIVLMGIGLAVIALACRRHRHITMTAA